MAYQDLRYRDPEYGTKWREAHPEVVRERSRRYLDDPRHREANRLRASRYYYANQEERQAKQRAYYRENKARLAETTMARKYGLTVDDYRAMVASHGGVCAICKAEALLSVDHDHETGAVRGLLCSTCNFMIGHGKDDPALLRAAAAYLEGK